MSRGGTAALARALENAVRESGGEIRLITEPAQIVVENGKAVGIETSEGELLRAKTFVASALNPQQTFLDLLDEKLVPRKIRDLASNFQYNLLAPLFALHLNLKEAPQYAAAKNNPALAKAFMVIMGLDHVDQFNDIVRHHEAGTVPDTVMWGATPSLFDGAQAPKGKHTAFMWEKLPYKLKGDPKNWENYGEAHGRKMLELWKKHAPNLEGAVLDSFTRTPLDVERELPNMREADLLIGAFTNNQIGHDRPFPGAGNYRAHIPNLYLCGSSSHPGGNVTGLPGYNAAQVILADLGIKADWAPPPISERLKALC
jgi:phytoene dehydrogenase-like protein